VGLDQSSHPVCVTGQKDLDNPQVLTSRSAMRKGLSAYPNPTLGSLLRQASCGLHPTRTGQSRIFQRVIAFLGPGTDDDELLAGYLCQDWSCCMRQQWSARTYGEPRWPRKGIENILIC
jgi:hypothetical protein